MRIFTLGKNGIPLFFFTLLLFSGTYSYGQNCPTVDDTTQEFCYPSTVADLVATENGEAVRWYRTTASTNPIPQNELLEDETTYYAGNASGTCTARVAVLVTINELPAPVSQTGNFWQACLYGETDEDVITVANLIDRISTTDDAYFIEVFPTETSETAMELDDVLVAGNTYYVAQSETDGCSSPRLPINYDTVLTTVPTGEAVQIFCNTGDTTPTVADLEASGTNRWYSTETSSPALDDSTPLVHGERYYATRIVNRDDSNQPPCESIDRFEVLVSLEVIAENTIQTFCESEGTGNDGGAPTVSDLEPLNSTWYADMDFTTPLAPDTDLVDGTTYYLADTDGDCRTASVTAEITDSPSAGRTTEIDVCDNEEPFDLAAEMLDSDIGPADPGGTFSPALASGTTIFDPAVDAGGTYTYTVTSETNCPSDSAVITVNLYEAPNAGSDIDETFCSSELEDNEEALAARFLPYLSGRDINPDFFAVAESIYNQYLEDVATNDFPQTYTATYSVSNENCTDTAEISVTVSASPDAGEDNTIYLEDRDDSTITMINELNGTPAPGGVWTDSEGNVIDGTFDPLTDTIGAFTYTVTEGDCSASATLTIQDVQLDCPTVSDTTQEFCESVGTGNDGGAADVGDLVPASATWYATADATEALPDTTVLVDGASYFAGNATGDCANRTEVVVSLVDSPSAGRTTTVTVCSNEEAFDMVTRILPSAIGDADAGGTFSPAFVSGTTEFDPALDNAGTYTYTVQSTTDCDDDSAVITVVINDAPDAGDDAVVELAEEDTELITLFDELNGTPVAGGTWSNGDGTFDPTTDTPGVFTYTVTANGCTDTATVTITMDVVEGCPEVADTTQEFCESVGTGNDGGAANVGDLEPATATWYATADANEALPDTTVLVDGASYFAGNASGDCANRTEVVVSLVDSPSAGRTTTVTVCSNEEAFDMVTRILPSAIGDADAGGTFSPAFVSGTTEFDPALDNAGTYTYTVQSTTDCDDDSAVITVVINDAPDAGDDAVVELAEEDTELITLFDELNGTPVAGGTWSNGDGTFDPTTDTPGVFTYTVTANGCTDTATVTITMDVVEGCPEVADTTQEFCESVGTGNDGGAANVGDLEPATATWYATADANEALPDTTVLVDGASYFAGNASGDCANRTEVVVSLVDSPSAGRTTTVTVCSNEEAFDMVTRILPSAIGDADAGGTFSPAFVSGTTEFDPALDNAGTYTYTVQSTTDCDDDSAVITVVINDAPDAGDDAVVELAEEDTELITLFDELNGTPVAGGTWSNGDGTFDPTTDTPGVFTYTVTANGCTDTATVTITIEDVVEGCPEVTDVNQAFCESILSGNDSRLPNVSDLLPADATWYTSADATDALAENTVLENGVTYYAGNASGTCDARQSVTVTLDDSPNAGGTTQLTFCENAEAVDLLTVMDPSILGAPDAGGTFSPALASGTTVFDPTLDAAGTYTYTVESTNDVCPTDSAVVSITITPAADAGPGGEFEFCSTQGPQDLFAALAEAGVTTEGTFEGLENGIFDPGVNESGEYVYSVEETGGCEGTSTAIYTITVNETPAAPAATDLSFCISENATVADLTENTPGDELLWYTDAELQNLADEADALVEGTYYVTDNNESGCPSAAAQVTVTLNDAPTPTLAEGGNIFCDFDEPTIADLQEFVSASGTITWYDAMTGGNIVSSSTQLQNGTTYYAASTDATSTCESSVRLPVTVDLEDCPVIIPEAFSPNGDNVNDTFEIEHIGSEFPNFTIEIYNRWGNKVFQGNANTPNWDGVSTESRSLGDKVLPVGVYFYIVNYNDGQTAPTQGRLYLSR